MTEEIRFARHENNDCITAHRVQMNLEMYKDSKFTCLVCEETLVFVKSHERFIKRNGLTIPVLAHFRHTSGFKQHSNESYEHLAAKTHLVHHIHDFEFYHDCVYCQKRTVIDVFQKNVTTTNLETVIAVPEFTYLKYRLDVAIVRYSEHGDDVVGCVEVCHTNPMETEKRDDLTNAGVAWVEISAHDILPFIDQITTGEDDDTFPKPVKVLHCALLIDACPMCWQDAEQLLQAENAQTHLENQLAPLREERTRLVNVFKEFQQLQNEISKYQTIVSELHHAQLRFKTLLQQHHTLVNENQMLEKDVQVQQRKRKLESQNDKYPPEYELTFGKHQGDNVLHVMEVDPKYIVWLAFECNTVNDTIRERCLQLLTGKCHRCMQPTVKKWHTFCTTCYQYNMRQNKKQ